MRKICVLVDNTAQFPHHSFPGQNLIRIIPHDIELRRVLYPEGNNLKVFQLPNSAWGNLNPRLIPPSAEKFNQLFLNVGSEFDELIVLTHSAHLSTTYANACLASTALHGRLPVIVVDTNTFSAGLGILAQLAAEAIHNGANLVEVEHLVRRQSAHIYTVICSPGLSYLYHSGIVDQAQAIVGEMLNMMPLFSIEDERLTPVEKVRNVRNTVELFIEFVEEFDKLRHIALIQCAPPLLPETRSIRQAFLERYPQTTYSEHNINLPSAILFGPRVVGLVAIENPSE